MPFRLVWIYCLSLRVNDNCGECTFSTFADQSKNSYCSKETSFLDSRIPDNVDSATVDALYVARFAWKIQCLQAEMQSLNFFPLPGPQLWTYWAVLSNSDGDLAWKACMCSLKKWRTFQGDSGFAPLYGKATVWACASGTWASAHMSILNSLGLGKTLDTSLGREWSQEAKSY